MALSLFWYDLETSGVNPKEDRIMQFAGQRTDMELRLIGEPVNVLVRMTEDILPDPEAVLLTGITPQMTLEDGLSEAAFLSKFNTSIAVPGTVFTGYNSVRFDDEFMRYSHYRNFYDPYEWHWKDSRSRWDLLDVVRMTRALRPGSINWPKDSTGKPTNRLEVITAFNKLEHSNAHDALSDVMALIALARLIRNKQRKIFDFLLSMRDKNKVAALVTSGEPFIYTSGRYQGQYEKTSVAIMIGEAKNQGVLVYDLRYEPNIYKDMTPAELVRAWQYKRDAPDSRLPVKVLRFNRCPAVAPLSVLNGESRERIKIDLADVRQHAKSLKKMPDFAAKLRKAEELMDDERQLSVFPDNEFIVDEQLYDGFFNYHDRQLLSVVRAAQPNELGSLNLSFNDDRLNNLLPLYTARNFPRAVNSEQRAVWEKYRKHRLFFGGQSSRMAKYLSQLQSLDKKSKLSPKKKYLIDELKLYGESVMPADGYQ